MEKFAVFLLAGLSFVAISAWGADESCLKTAAVGSADVLSFDENGELEVLVGNPGVISAVMQGKSQVIVTPLKKGTSSLIVIRKSGRILRNCIYNIIDAENISHLVAIRRLLRDIEGIHMETIGEQIVIDGEILDPLDMDRIVKVAGRYPEVLNLVKVSKGTYTSRAVVMEEEIRKDLRSEDVRVMFVNGTYILSGHVPSRAHRDRAELIAQTLLPEFQSSEALAQGVLVNGAKKFSIRNEIVVDGP